MSPETALAQLRTAVGRKQRVAALRAQADRIAAARRARQQLIEAAFKLNEALK